ncbi:MAG: hypothetical protein ACREAB_04855 [Blastocatellia bacterium]
MINQSHSLFIGETLNPEAHYEHYEVGNRVQYIEKHLESPLISLIVKMRGLPSASFF